MPVELNIGNFKTRENTSQQWEPTAIVVESDLETVLEITGDGNIDPDFTATDLTGAANELKNTLTQLEDNLVSETLVRTGATNTGSPITAGTYFYLDGVYTQALQYIDTGASFTSSNKIAVTVGEVLTELNNGRVKVSTVEITTNNTGDFHIPTSFGINVSRIVSVIPVSDNSNDQIVFSGNGWASVRTKDGCVAVTGPYTTTISVYYI